jgi:hypothetical protein
MYHTIEFHSDLVVTVEVSRKQPLERLSIPKGTRRSAQVKPAVVEMHTAWSKWRTCSSTTGPPPARCRLHGSLLWTSRPRQRRPHYQ